MQGVGVQYKTHKMIIKETFCNSHIGGLDLL
jgi:hypothetical protein